MEKKWESGNKVLREVTGSKICCGKEGGKERSEGNREARRYLHLGRDEWMNDREGGAKEGRERGKKE